MEDINNFEGIQQLADLLLKTLERKIEISQEPMRLLTLHEVAELLSISHQHLTKNVMHNPGFPKPVRLNERGSLRFYKHEIEEYMWGLKKKA